jgi:hypothetical protein
MKYFCVKAITVLLLLVIVPKEGFSQFKFLFTSTSDQGTVPVKPDTTRVGPKLKIKFQPSIISSASNNDLTILLPDINFPDGREVYIKKNKQAAGVGYFTWYGVIKDQPGSFVLLTQVGDAVAGYIRTNTNKIYSIEYIGNKVHIISQIDQSRFKPDKVVSPGNVLNNENAREAAANCCDRDTIDVLVVYTREAREAAADSGGIESQIRQSVQMTNESFLHSQIPAWINLAHTQEIDYTEITDMEKTRNDLQNNNDGIMDTVHFLRDQFSADIVILIIEYGNRTNTTGFSNIMRQVTPSFESLAFCVVKRNAAYQNLIFPHEIGHILGARHQCAEDNTSLPYVYGHGWSNDSFRTIMSTNYIHPGIEFWSDPNIVYPNTGQPTSGTLDECPANEAECLRQTIATVSKFRCKHSCEPPPPPLPPASSSSNWIWWVLLGLVAVGISIWLIAKRE